MLLKDIAQKYKLDLENMPTETEFPTGISALDDNVWFSRRNLNVIASRPSNNKSTFILNSLAVPVAENGKSVIIYTLEDSYYRYLRRYLACKSGIETRKIQQKKTTDTENEKLDMWINKIEELPLEIIEGVGYTIAEIEKDLQNKTPDLVILDYINKIKTIGTRIDTINDYLRQFSLLTKKYNFCGVICCQVNREAMGEGNNQTVHPPQLHHIKESGDIEQICDVAILLHWGYKYTGQNKNNIQILIAKNKDGDTLSINSHIEPEINKITNFRF